MSDSPYDTAPPANPPSQSLLAFFANFLWLTTNNGTFTVEDNENGTTTLEGLPTGEDLTNVLQALSPIVNAPATEAPGAAIQAFWNQMIDTIQNGSPVSNNKTVTVRTGVDANGSPITVKGVVNYGLALDLVKDLFADLANLQDPTAQPRPLYTEGDGCRFEDILTIIPPAAAE